MADVAEFRDFRLVDIHQSWTPGGPVASRLPEPEIDVLEGRAAATMGEPSTLGLFGLATGTWLAGLVFGGFVSVAAEPALGVLLVLFAGIAQFIAGLYGFRRMNTLTASMFCCFGALYVVVGLMLLAASGGVVPRIAASSDVLGLLFISFGFISLAFLAASTRRNAVLMGIMLFLTAGYTLTGISLITTGAAGGVATAAGIILFIAGFLAYYLGMALVVNSSWKRTILPVLGEA